MQSEVDKWIEDRENTGQDNILNDKNTQENSNTYTLKKKR